MTTGLQAYLEQQQANQQQSMGNLQMAQVAQSLQAGMEKQRADQQLKVALAESGGDVEKALAAALQSGNVTAAHQLAPLVESARKQKQLQQLQGMDLNALLDNPQAALAAQTLNPHIGPELERLRAVRDRQSEASAMRSRPAIQPDPQENAIAADQGTPPVAAVPAKPGMFSSFLTSEVPNVPEAAKMWQEQVDKAGSNVTPAQINQWRQAATYLSNKETSYQQAQALKGPEPLVAILRDGKSVLVPRSQAVGATPANAMNQGDSVNPDNAHLHGDEYIKTLPAGMQNVVKGLIEYKLPLNQLSSRTGERKAAFEHAAQADPNFNVAKYQQRQKVMNDFTSGPTANNLTALDQALNHMGTLSQLASALQNNDVPAINAVVNEVRKQTGDPRVTNFVTAQQAVATELMRVFRQVNASEQETKEWMAHFPLNGSPAQIQQALGTGAKLLEGRVNALNTRWNNGMDTDTGYPRLMSPQAKQSLDALLGRSAAPSAASAQEFATEADAAKAGLKPGTRVKIGGKTGTWQ